MANRLSRIVTRTGDGGTTGLGNNTRVPKDCARVEAMGDIDELNSCIGMTVSAIAQGPATEHADVATVLTAIQHDLFALGGEIATPGMNLVTDERVAWLEAQIEQFNGTLPPLKEFILPGGPPAAAACHLARTTCRRAERHTWALSRLENVNAAVLLYLNRLSDLLFVLSRVLARSASHGKAEALWDNPLR